MTTSAEDEQPETRCTEHLENRDRDSPSWEKNKVERCWLTAGENVTTWVNVRQRETSDGRFRVIKLNPKKIWRDLKCSVTNRLVACDKKSLRSQTTHRQSLKIEVHKVRAAQTKQLADDVVASIGDDDSQVEEPTAGREVFSVRRK